VRIPRDRAAFESALRIEERRLHHVLGIVMVPQLTFDESNQPGAVLPIQLLDLGGHAYSVPAQRWEPNDAGAYVALAAVTTGDELRGLMRLWPHGVSILSVDVDSDRMGVTVSSLVSLSLEPPLIGVSIGKEASCYELLRSAGRFAVSLLGSEQEELARRFAGGYPPIVHWQGVPTREGQVAPLIDGALGWIEAETRNEADAGDHTFFIADVLSIEHGPSHHALVYRESMYHSV
jgi:flavin reductase (DIM6/NTAB) family NADH-FMN oxidoreductase RutF